MVGRLLAKLGVASSTITGVVYLHVAPNNSSKVMSEEETEQATEDLKTIEDIELFERVHGCNFVFVNNWDHGVLYSARAFEEKNKDWTKEIIKGVNDLKNGEAKKLCKRDGGVVTLFDDRNNNQFRLGVPDSGRW